MCWNNEDKSTAHAEKKTGVVGGGFNRSKVTKKKESRYIAALSSVCACACA